MAACRSPLQFSRGGLREWYRRYSTSAIVCNRCECRRSLNFRPFSQAQVNGLPRFRDDQVTKPSLPLNKPPQTVEEQWCFRVTGIFSNINTLGNGTVELVRPTKQCAVGMGTQMTPVLIKSFNSLLRRISSKCSPKISGSLRHFCSDEFKGHKDEAGEVMGVKGHTGSADSGSRNMDEIVDDEIDELTGLRNCDERKIIPKLNIYADNTTDLRSELSTSLNPPPPPPVKVDAYNLAPFVAKSDVLRFLLNLNVNLATIETRPKVSSSLVKLDLEQDVMPVIYFLKDAGIPDNKLAKVIALHPFIFDEFDKAKLVMEYLKLKTFKKESIAHMIVGAPQVLGLKVLTIDMRIGAYQTFFNLTGAQVRDVMTRVPRILLSHTDELKETIEMLAILEFSNDQLKKMLLHCPSIFKDPKNRNLEHRLKYLLMNIPMDQNTIAAFSHVLLYPSNPIKERHLFLLELGCAQYDPTKEKYISPTDLVCTPERKFCKLARTTPAIFRDFKMTL